MIYCNFELREWKEKVGFGKGGNFHQTTGAVTGRYVGERVLCIYLYIMCVYRSVFTRTYIRESTSVDFLRPYQVTSRCKPFLLS